MSFYLVYINVNVYFLVSVISQNFILFEIYLDA